ncbi:MAG: FtsX-like permease family protein [Chitinophagia bacterium]
MKLAFYIARKLAFSSNRSFSAFIIRLSIAATAVSVMALIITLSFVNGFQKEVAGKVFSFWGHIRVQQYIPGKSIVAEELPMKRSDSLEKIIKHIPGIQKVQSFATKSAVMENRKEIEGILLKGIGREYDSIPFQKFMVSGTWIQFPDSGYSRDVLISADQAKLLNIHLNDTIFLYFISSLEGNKTYRKVRVAGMYKTAIAEYDQLFVMGDLRLLQRVNEWNEQQIGGYELFVQDYKQLALIQKELTNQLPLQVSSNTIEEIFPNIFDWLAIQNMNRNVLFTILGLVAVINLATCLLVLILERTRMVGILQTMGASGKMIRLIFLFHALWIAIAGIGLGCLAGLSLSWLQMATGFIKLDEASYYVSVAPVHLIGWQIGAVVFAAFLLCFLCLLLPTFIIRPNRPIQYIRLN